jgi:hypothetical protein
MTRNISLRTTLRKNLDDVWNYLADFDNAHQWMPGVKSVIQVDPGEVGRGSVLEFIDGRSVKVVKVSYWEPLKCFTLSFESSSRSTDSSYRLEPDGQHTILELNITTSVDGFRQFLLPVASIFHGQDARNRLKNIKHVIESRPHYTG